MCYMPPKRIFKKSKNFEFFLKKGVKGVKNLNFEKIVPKSKRALKIFKKSQNFEFFFIKRGLRGPKN